MNIYICIKVCSLFSYFHRSTWRHRCPDHADHVRLGLLCAVCGSRCSRDICASEEGKEGEEDWRGISRATVEDTGERERERDCVTIVNYTLSLLYTAQHDTKQFARKTQPPPQKQT